jgi:hypothetical protein
MMNENNNPFASDPWQLTSNYRPREVTYKPNGKPDEPIGYVDIEIARFDQTNEGIVNGGNCYFNLFGNSTFDQNGTINLVATDNPFVNHAPETWVDEINFDQQVTHEKIYGHIYVNLTISDRWEDHIPFRGVIFKYKIKKVTRKTEQYFTIIDPPYDGVPYTSIPGDIDEKSKEEEDFNFDVNMPEDIDLALHSFSTSNFTQEQNIDKGYVLPKGGTFQDGTPKWGYDAIHYEQEENRYYLDQPPIAGQFYTVITKRIVTYITYVLDPWTAVEETCTPPAFYNT